MTAATCPACGHDVPRALTGSAHCSARCERTARLRQVLPAYSDDPVAAALADSLRAVDIRLPDLPGEPPPAAG